MNILHLIPNTQLHYWKMSSKSVNNKRWKDVFNMQVIPSLATRTGRYVVGCEGTRRAGRGVAGRATHVRSA